MRVAVVVPRYANGSRVSVFFFVVAPQNWNTLRDGPAPYKPDGADEMSELLERVKHVAAGSPEMPDLVKRITANFDDFEEVKNERNTRTAVTTSKFL